MDWFIYDWENYVQLKKIRIIGLRFCLTISLYYWYALFFHAHWDLPILLFALISLPMHFSERKCTKQINNKSLYKGHQRMALANPWEGFFS